jgi:hypothetical protein
MLFLPGCVAHRAVDTVDKMVELMHDIEVRKMELEKELRLESHQIEGTVVKTEMVEKIVKVPLDDESKKKLEELKKEMEELDKQPNVSFKAELFCEKEEKKQVFVVTFQDGREKEFNTIPTRPFVSGEYYIIEYNGLDEIKMITRD